MTPPRRGVTDQAANAAVDQACRVLRLPTIRTRFGEIADAGWTSYVPQSGLAFSPGHGVDFYILGIHLLAGGAPHAGRLLQVGGALGRPRLAGDGGRLLRLRVGPCQPAPALLVVAEGREPRPTGRHCRPAESCRSAAAARPGPRGGQQQSGPPKRAQVDLEERLALVARGNDLLHVERGAVAGVR